MLLLNSLIAILTTLIIYSEIVRTISQTHTPFSNDVIFLTQHQNKTLIVECNGMIPCQHAFYNASPYIYDLRWDGYYGSNYYLFTCIDILGSMRLKDVISLAFMFILRFTTPIAILSNYTVLQWYAVIAVIMSTVCGFTLIFNIPAMVDAEQYSIDANRLPCEKAATNAITKLVLCLLILVEDVFLLYQIIKRKNYKLNFSK
jgi:hypothetical protein